MRLLTIFSLICALSSQALAQHDRGAGRPSGGGAGGWTNKPLLLPAGARGERDAARVSALGIGAESLAVYAPAGAPETRRRDFPIGPDGAKIASGSPKVGNYHWVVMREETPELVKIASTAWYFGNPGPSPRSLLAETRHELEIIPDPLPREHGCYRESEKWRFLVRLNGAPLADQALILETELGTRTTFFTDQSGVATVLFPRDFRLQLAARRDGEAGGGHARDSAKFVLSTEKQINERRYLTAFNLTYGPDTERGRSLAWGAGFCLAGMLVATPLLRRRSVLKTGERSDA